MREGVPAFVLLAKRATPGAEAAAVAGSREAAGPELGRQTKTASPVREDRSRCAHFSFCGRESDVRYPGFVANVEDTDDILVSARFIATNDHRLLGVELDEALEQVG